MNDTHDTWHIYIDGASRKNPGKAGAGIYIEKNGQTVCREGFFLGIKTNNQAEYIALLLALYFITKYAKPNDTIRIASDSELLVKQIKGQYRVKNNGLQPLFACAQQLMQPYMIEMLHVFRADNTIADSLANQGIDSKKLPPAKFVELMKHYHITIAD